MNTTRKVNNRLLVTYINVTTEPDTISCELVVLLLILMDSGSLFCFPIPLLRFLTDSSESLVHNIH